MNILLLGADGQIGWELRRSLAPLGTLKACGRDEADLEDQDALRTLVRSYRPDVIVNAAAHTGVDKAEVEPDKTSRVNAQAVGLLAGEAKQLDSWLVHYSTDYVYDGKKDGAYLETDKTNPLSVYGKTKLQGEEAIRNSDCKHLIFRTSWVYAARGNNFVKTMLRLASEREELRVVSDQIGAPTSAELVADVTSLCVQSILQERGSVPNVEGLYHLAAVGEASWFDLAKYAIMEVQKLGQSIKIRPENIHPIQTSEYPLPAVRPANSVLNTEKLCSTFNLHMPHWKVHVDRLIRELQS